MRASVDKDDRLESRCARETAASEGFGALVRRARSDRINVSGRISCVFLRSNAVSVFLYFLCFVDLHDLTQRMNE